MDENQNNTDGIWCNVEGSDWMFTVVPVYILVISVLGIILNVFVLMVLGLHKKACTVVEIYWSNLAAADLFLMSSLPFWALNVAKKYDWKLSKTMCKLIPFSITMNTYCSICILVLVSIDRYLALVRPLTSARIRKPFCAKLACVVVWGVCFFLNVPALIFREVLHFPEGNFSRCNHNVSSPTMYLAYQGISVFSFIIPIFIISFCTVKIIHTLRKRLNIQKMEQKAIILILVVFLAFLICWVPYHVVQILDLLSRLNIVGLCTTHLNFFHLIFTYLSLLNSVLNPILYVIVGKNFQTKVKELFRQMSTKLSRCL
ncbi:B2 bradykinin receptor-like [Stegastes partitus]|uniref:B2 bradykinin receptor-like n=1 Tax=Stegastes partitus TaxID=144197 RepID=A0A9Y4JKZ3_9TELE|nr:PREDICTED: B2 bradykinin receptor-like [Stegastes partitus]